MQEFIDYITRKYPERNAEEAQSIVEYCYMTLLYRLNEVNKTYEQLTSLEQIWIRSAIDEVISRDGYDGVVQYSENGYHIMFETDGFSKGLLSLITPKVNKVI